MSRADFRARRIALERARRKARQSHAQPCDCAYCITAERAHELLTLRAAETARRSGEVPF